MVLQSTYVRIRHIDVPPSGSHPLAERLLDEPLPLDVE
jgi:hypothetical protein